MNKSNISRIKDEEFVTFSYISSFDTELQKKNREQWRKVLGTFDLIKDKTLFQKTKPRRKKHIIHQTRENTAFRRNTSGRRVLSSSLINSFDEDNFSQVKLNESDIVWSSSNEDSDSALDVTILNKRTNKSRYEGRSKVCQHEAEISWSSSNESENEENVSFNKESHISRCKNDLKRKLYDSEINWSSNESEHEFNSTQMSTLAAFHKKDDSKCELDSFLREIEKDLRRTKKIKLKLTTKKGGYVDGLQRAIKKAKSDTSFLDYEQRADIICGCKGLIMEKKMSYGSYLANVKMEASSNCNIILGKNMQSIENGCAVVCFLDESNVYTLNNSNVYVQPNKVIRAS